MTDKEKIINNVQGKLSQALRNLRIREINFLKSDGISFNAYGWTIELSINAKKNRNGK